MTQEEKPNSIQFYDLVFARFTMILREAHKKLNFGHITVFVERTQFNIRWTVRRKGHKKFTYNIPLKFKDLADKNISHNEMWTISTEIVDAALSTIPKDLIRIDNG